MASQVVSAQSLLKMKLQVCDLVKTSYDEAKKHHPGAIGPSFDMAGWTLSHVREVLGEVTPKDTFFDLRFQDIIKYGLHLNDIQFLRKVLSSIAPSFHHHTILSGLRMVAQFSFTKHELSLYFDCVLEAAIPFMRKPNQYAMESVRDIMGLREKVPSNAVITYCAKALEMYLDADKEVELKSMLAVLAKKRKADDDAEHSKGRQRRQKQDTMFVRG